MPRLDHLIEELVTANRILAREGVVDSFGHISVRHPDNPQRYLLSRSRAPDCIESGDIMEFTLDGSPVDPRGRASYLERFIHGALYEARPDIMSVVHNHSESVIPFGVAGKDIRQAVYISVYLEVNARLQKQAMDMGEIKFLTAGEVNEVSGRTGSYGINRAWENWCRRAGRPFQADAGRG